MPEIDLIEKASELGIEITEDEADIIASEITLLESSFEATKKVFTIKLTDLITKLEARDMTEEQVINVLLDDLENDGALFGGLKRQLIGDAQESIELMESRLNAKQFAKTKEKLTWIAVLVNTCPDCLPRHGVTKSYTEWQKIGLPRSGFSVCRSRCQCQLLPASVIDESKEELREPLRRVKGKITQIAKEKNVVSVKRYVNRKLGSINDTKDPIRKEYRKLLPGFKR